VRENLISLCRPNFSTGYAGCHREAHDGNISREEIRRIIAMRERISEEKVDQRFYDLRRPKCPQRR
jgi:hypothetical protein